VVRQIEARYEEKRAIDNVLRDHWAEAKDRGFDLKALRVLISLRRMDREERTQLDGVVATYMQACDEAEAEEKKSGAQERVALTDPEREARLS
jgi:uncharacterized protein (UPF0335 family)